MAALTLILYKPGYAGNFLARCLSLEPDTLPFFDRGTPRAALATWSQQDRFEQYRFTTVMDRYGSWLDCHMADAGPHERIDTVTRSGPHFDHCINVLHPRDYHDWFFHYLDLTMFSAFKVIHVTLDTDAYREWFARQSDNIGLIRFPRIGEAEAEQIICDKYGSTPVDLGPVLDSEEGFLKTFAQMSQIVFGEARNPTLALDLYRDWNSVRGLEATAKLKKDWQPPEDT